MRLSKYGMVGEESPQLLKINRYVIYCRKSSESDERQIQSLGDQMNTLLPFVKQRSLTIVGESLQESKSAKEPGRPIFNEMVQMIEEGHANGIILLNPTRLSRNTVDTGHIIFLMDQGKLDEVVTPSQTFKNNPYDKFMLNLLCTQAKLENDNKSVSVRDAMRMKAERGDFPGIARPGYMNNHSKNQGQRDISPHPIYFSLVRKWFDVALTGNYSVEALTKKAKDMGIRSINGNIIGKTSIFRYLRDPFYTGKFLYKGKLYNGNHKTMLTDDEFNLLQDIIDGKSKGKLQKHIFALNGMIVCGECKYCITAEAHTKTYASGKKQTFGYYRCSKKSKEIKCSQGYLSENKAKDQIVDDLVTLELEDEFEQWAFEALEKAKGEVHTLAVNKMQALQNALDGINKRLSNLTELKISPDNSDGSLLSDEEFAQKKRLLLTEKDKLLYQIKNENLDQETWEFIKDSFEFGLRAKKRYEDDIPDEQKVIVKTIWSNLILLDQNLQFQPRPLYFIYKKAIKRFNVEKSRLVPKKGLPYQANFEFYSKNEIWYSRRDSNPQPTR